MKVKISKKARKILSNPNDALLLSKKLSEKKTRELIEIELEDGRIVKIKQANFKK